jgi:hypothetical protein
MIFVSYILTYEFLVLSISSSVYPTCKGFVLLNVSEANLAALDFMIKVGRLELEYPAFMVSEPKSIKIA